MRLPGEFGNTNRDVRMAEFVKVAEANHLSDPGKQLVEVDGRLVVIFHVDGKYYCLDDVCTHDGGPLGDGELDGTAIACPRHGAKFDICTGKALSMPATMSTLAHQVRSDDQGIYVKLSDSD